MVTNNITITNDMVTTERIIRHTLCCPHCGGSIRLKPDKPANEMKGFSKAPQGKFLYTNSAFLKPLNALQLPTCTVCGKQFQITVDTNNFVIEIKEL